MTGRRLATFMLRIVAAVTFAVLISAALAHAASDLVVAYCRPRVLRPGTQRSLTLYGDGFSATGAVVPTVTVSGLGVTVDGVRAVRSDRLRVTIRIDAAAAPGLRDVTVVNPDGTRRTARSALMLSDGRVARAVLKGRVRASGVARDIADARVTLFASDLSMFREVRTSHKGRWALVGVDPGTYRLGIAALGFDYIEHTLTVPGDAGGISGLVAESHPGSWAIIGDTAPEFLDATDIAILTADGRVFYCHDTQDPVVFDPTSGQKTFPASSPSEQGCTAATLLADDRIIFIGGQNPADPGSFTNAVPWVKSYRPSGWTLLPSLQLAAGRWYPGLARLADGSLLVMGGGMAPDARRTDTAERFDLASETWSYTGTMLAPAEYPPAALLYTGEVLITWAFPQLYNPVTGMWRATAGFIQGNRGYPDHSDHSLVVLADGRALAVGIRRSGAEPVMAEVYDPGTAAWRLTADSALPRKRPEVVQLPDGKVLAAAGEVEGTPPVPNVLGMVKWTDLYDPAADHWRRVADMLEFREYHAITLLVPDGRVVTTGGTRIKFQVGPSSTNIEAYSPPYLFRGVRPTISSVSATTAPRGEMLTLSVFPETEITSVVLIGTGATTHWVDGGIPRRLVLPVAQGDTSVEVQLPTDAALLPLGHYLLFAMVDDIPSVGIVIRVSGS